MSRIQFHLCSFRFFSVVMRVLEIVLSFISIDWKAYVRTRATGCFQAYNHHQLIMQRLTNINLCCCFVGLAVALLRDMTASVVRFSACVCVQPTKMNTIVCVRIVNHNNLFVFAQRMKQISVYKWNILRNHIFVKLRDDRGVFCAFCMIAI